MNWFWKGTGAVQIMKRVIKFNGKRIDTGEWVEGSLVDIDQPEMTIWTKKHTAHAVILETVGQFGNCHDKTGYDIYENHIIKYSKRLFVVVFESWGIVCKPIDKGNMWPHFNQATMNGAEIVGNVFDNPELLIIEGAKDQLALFKEAS
jgi:hypothetical protein